MKLTQDIDVHRIDVSIQELKKHITDFSIEPVIEVLEALKKDPQDESIMDQLVEMLGKLGPFQGAVLTYAPYISLLLSEDPFGENRS